MNKVELRHSYQGVTLSIDGNPIASCQIGKIPSWNCDTQHEEQMDAVVIAGGRDVVVTERSIGAVAHAEAWRSRMVALLNGMLGVSPTHGYAVMGSSDNDPQARRERALVDAKLAFGGHFTAFFQILCDWIENVPVGEIGIEYESPKPDISPAGVDR